jgi:hypothetical protein
LHAVDIDAAGLFYAEQTGRDVTDVGRWVGLAFWRTAVGLRASTGVPWKERPTTPSPSHCVMACPN